MLPNLLSLTRIPLAFLFFFENATIRASAVLLAMLTDGLDGYIARRYQMTTRFGTLIDPLTDRFFVVVALIALMKSSPLELWQVAALFSRDVAILIFALYLWIVKKHKFYYLRALWCGKITTALQLMVLFSLTFRLEIPPPIYYIFYALGALAFVELSLSEPSPTTTSKRRELS